LSFSLSRDHLSVGVSVHEGFPLAESALAGTVVAGFFILLISVQKMEGKKALRANMPMLY